MTHLNHEHTYGHDRPSATVTAGEAYKPRPLSALVADKRVRHQRRCVGGCGGAA